jgi:hypothetical protein
MTSIGNTGSAVGVDTEYEKSLITGIRDDASLHSEYDQTGSFWEMNSPRGWRQMSATVFLTRIL